MRVAWGRWVAALHAGAVLVALGCSKPAPPPKEWLSGEADARFSTLSRHLRGLDVAMVEAGYRYAELYWDGTDRNWEAAAYQAAKIRLTLELALERRPNRGASMRPFLDGPLAGVEEAIAAHEVALFAERFEVLTAGCNGCHAAEKVAFFHVAPPAGRASVLRSEGSVR